MSKDPNKETFRLSNNRSKISCAAHEKAHHGFSTGFTNYGFVTEHWMAASQPVVSAENNFGDAGKKSKIRNIIQDISREKYKMGRASFSADS